MEKYEDFLYRIGSGSSQEEFSDLLVTYSFAKEVRNGNKSYENEDLKDGRSLDRYNKFIKFVTARNPKNYLMNDFATANQDYVFEMAAIIINKILGDNKQLMEEFMEFMSYIKVRESEEVLNGISYKMLNDLNGDIIYNVLLPSITNISSIVCIIHEFIHFHFQKNNMEPKKFYYGEILTILFEKIAADFLQEWNLDQQMIHKIENVRIDSLKYHYTTQKEDIKLIKQYNSMVELQYYEYTRRLYTEFKAYYDLLAQSYGIGYLYAESLFNLYKENPQEFQKKLNSILCDEMSLQEVLDFYNINTGNKQVFEDAKKKIRMVTE